MTESPKILVQVRGEVGEVIHGWCLMRHFLSGRAAQATGDIDKDMKNRNLWFLNAIINKLEDDIVARLSELAEPVRRGRINFENLKWHIQRLGLDLATRNLDKLRLFLKANRFEEKRNHEISHKRFVIDWNEEMAEIHIPYRVLLRALGLAVRTMKDFDHTFYGKVHARFMWRELRRKRYDSMLLPRAGYMIAEHIYIPASVRAQLIMSELQSGKFEQEIIETAVNGKRVQLYASKKWGAINLGGRLLILDQYPLQRLQSIEGEGIVIEPEQSEKSPSHIEPPDS